MRSIQGYRIRGIFMAAVKKSVSLLISEPLLKKHVEEMFDLSNNRNFLFHQRPPYLLRILQK